MKIDINKDFEENYKNTWKSLTTEEVITAGIALLFAGGVVYLAWRFLGIPIEIGVYLGLPVMIPIVGIGVYKYQGTNAFKLIREVIYFLKTRRLYYEAEEFDEKKIRIFTMRRK